MAETYFIRDLLAAELELEVSKTRRLFEALPGGSAEFEFRPHERSMTLGRLAGHMADIYTLIVLTLTTNELDMAAGWRPFTAMNRAELLERFEDRAERVREAFQGISDQAFREPWSIRRGPNLLFSADRFTYYRNQGINQIVHHRAQLGTYIRALGLPLPGMYGASADGI